MIMKVASYFFLILAIIAGICFVYFLHRPEEIGTLPLVGLFIEFFYMLCFYIVINPKSSERVRDWTMLVMIMGLVSVLTLLVVTSI
jgi:hypothetical protein